MDLQLLRKIPLFSTLSTEQLRKIAAITAERQVPVGKFVFKDEEPGDEMFLIVEGRVRISKTVPGIGEEALMILDPGSYFGEMAIIDEAPRSADARAHTSVTLRVIKKEALDELMFVDKDLAYELLWNFVRTLSTRLRDSNEKIKAFFALSKFG